MAYGKSGGCAPITSKIKRTTKGGVVQPMLNVGKVSPAKMKGDLNKDGKMSGYEQKRQDAIDKSMSSPAKLTPSERRAQSNKVRAASKQAKEFAKAKEQNKLDKSKPLSEYLPTTRKAVEKRMKAFDAKYGTKKTSPKTTTKTTTSKSSGGSMTPTSVENGKGKIHGPKVSYDMAYKNRDMKTYGGMSKADYIKEAKRQTKSFKSTGSWDAPKPRKKQTAVVAPKTKTVSIETKQPKATVEVKVTKTAKPTKTQARKAKSIDKKLAKAEKARAQGNIKKAERKEKRAARKASRIAKRAKK